MTKLGFFSILTGAALLSTFGCETKSGPIEAAEKQAEQAAEQRSADAKEGPLDQHLAGEVAKERAELAIDVGASDAEVKQLEKQPAETAAQDLNKPGGAYPAR